MTLMLYSLCFAQYKNPFDIESKELLEEKKNNALLGNSNDADDLSFYYIFDDKILIEQGGYWASIAAENDNSGHCQFNYYELIAGFHIDSSIRGDYWLYQSIVRKYKTALEVNNLSTETFSLANDLDFQNILVTDNNLTDIQEGAWRGSGKAALLVANYYSEKNPEKYIYWIHIGAQNGNKECISKYIEILQNSNNPYDIKRASFWQHKLKLMGE